jgi:hypothetical protein
VIFFVAIFQAAFKVATSLVDLAFTEIEVFVSRTKGDMVVKLVLHARIHTNLPAQWQGGCTFFCAIGWRRIHLGVGSDRRR